MNVLIVDDEPFQRQSLRNLALWEEEKWAVAGEAADGAEAIRFLERTHVDLVLTDARMPVMDGIQLAREARSRFPSTRVVVLSAYNDFDLVKASFRSGVYDYLLKAEVDESEIRKILHQIRAELEEPSAAELRVRGYVAYETIRRKLDTGLAGVLDVADCRLSGSKFVCFGYRLASGGDSELARIGKRFRAFHGSLPIRIDQRKIVAIIGVPEGVEHSEVETFLEQYPNEDNWPCDATGPIPWAAGINPTFSDIGTLASEIATVDRKLEQSFFGGWNRVYRRFDEEESIIHVLETLRAKRHEFSSMFFKRSFGTTTQGSIRVEVANHLASPEAAEAIRRYFQWTVSQFQDFILQDSLAADETLLGLIRSLSDDIRNERDLAQLNSDQALIIDRLRALFESRQHLPTQAKMYIHSVLPGECYVSDIARHLGVTPEHLSRTFKSCEHVSLKSFISEQRVRIAQKLLADGTKKIYEIAEAAGFSSVEHFSRTFKKVVGVSPKHYV